MRLEEYLAAHYTASTAKSYQRWIEYYLSGMPGAEQASHQEIVGYLSKERTYQSRSNQHGLLQGIKKYYNYLLSVGVRQDHPAQHLQQRIKAGRSIGGKRLLSREELALIWEHYYAQGYRYEVLRWRNISAMGLLLWQGLDQSEQVGLQVEAIDLENGTIILPNQRLKVGRVLPLERCQMLPLYRYLEQDRPKLLGDQVDEGRLWLSHRGQRPASRDLLRSLLVPNQDLLPLYRLSANLIRMSVLRSKFEQGWSLSQVQYFAGHRYPSSTVRLPPKRSSSPRGRHPSLPPIAIAKKE